MREIADQFPQQFIMYHKGIGTWKDMMQLNTPRDFKTKVIVLVGDPGIGKSRFANEVATKLYNSVYYKPRGEWWDGMTEETECVIIDDFYGWLKYDELLKIMDRYPYRVPIKGAFVNFRPKCIIITSYALPDCLYSFAGYNTAAIRRRIDFNYFNEVPSICEVVENHSIETCPICKEASDTAAAAAAQPELVLERCDAMSSIQLSQWLDEFVAELAE